MYYSYMTDSANRAGDKTMESFLLFSLIGGVLAVDDRAGWQSLLAQPVFAGFLIGLLSGQPQTGIAVGVLLELVWLSILPMRGIRRPDQIAGGVVGAGTACMLLNSTGDPRFGFLISIGVFTGLLSGIGALWLAKPLYKFKDMKLSAFANSPRALDPRALGRMHLLQTASIFLIEMVMILVFLSLSLVLGEWISSFVHKSILDGTRFWSLLMPVFGIAALVQIYWHKFSIRFLFLSMTLMLLILWIR